MLNALSRRALLAALMAAAVTLAGCGSKDEAKKADEKKAEAVKPDPLKIGFIYVGPTGDAGWTFAHDNARKAVEQEFGDRVQTSFVESVPEGPDSERVVRDLVGQGNKLIFGTTFGYMETMLKVAEETKGVRFEHATGYKSAENMRTYDSRTYEGAYLVGVIAGKMTKSNKLGVVASVPIPEVLRNINAFTLGAQSVNPKVTTRVVWINKWFDPGKEREGAVALMDQGADVLMQNTDSTAVVQAANEKGKFAFGWDSDMSKFAPEAHLASAIINWAPYYKKAVREALDGGWKTEHNWWGLKEGAIDVVALSDKLPAEVKALVEARKQGIKDGSFVIWRGPIVDQAGKVMLAKDQVADDKWMHEIKWYVKGVQGAVPK